MESIVSKAKEKEIEEPGHSRMLGNMQVELSTDIEGLVLLRSYLHHESISAP